MPQSHYPFKSLKLLLQNLKNRFRFPTRQGMKSLYLCSSSLLPSLFPRPRLTTTLSEESKKQQRVKKFTPKAAKSGGLSSKAIPNKCKTCEGQGAIECPGCKGTGKNKKDGNIFERWKCFECQGFGLKSCPICGKGGLTPEQRGER